MPLTFPASPTVGQQSTQNGRTYSWSGIAWELVGNVVVHKDRHAVGGADALSPADIGAVPSAGGTLTGALTHAATQTFVSALGSQGSPSHTFTGDTNTGIYSPGADRIAIVTGGAIRLGINAEGRVGVGAFGTIARSLFVASPITGHTEAFGVLQQGVVQTDVTSVVGVYNIVHTAVDVASSYIHFSAAQGSLGEGTVLSSQIGYLASGSMTAATVNYGFRADIAAGTGRWNVASLGTAQNVFRGNVGIGASRETPSSALDVNGVITVASGSVSAPAITFSGDTNTGFFSPSADILAVATAGVERLRVDASGNIGVGFINPTVPLDVSGSTLRLRTARTPSATGAVGEVCWDADYVWICTATNTWRRVAHSTSGASSGTKTLSVFTPRDNQPPATAFATLDTVNSVLVLHFDAATTESATFVGVVPEGTPAGASLIVRLWWLSASATSGNVLWSAQAGGSAGILADLYDNAVQTLSAVSATLGNEVVTSITLPYIGSVSPSVGQRFRLRISRVAADASDTMADDAMLVAVEVRIA